MFVIFYDSATVRTVPEAFCNRVCPSVSECVHPIENLVNTKTGWNILHCFWDIISKTMKDVSSSFGHRNIWVHRCVDWGQRGQGHSRQGREKLFVTNFTKIRSHMYLSQGTYQLGFRSKCQRLRLQQSEAYRRRRPVEFHQVQTLFGTYLFYKLWF